jgi:large subunit ribosomal protein L18
MAVKDAKKASKNRRRAHIRRKNVYTYAQLIDDLRGHTLVTASSREVEGAENRTQAARKVGELIAKRAADMGLEAVVFDRGGNMYHGRVAALAEGARAGGLEF